MRYAKEIPQLIQDNTISKSKEDKKLATFIFSLFKYSPESMSKKKDKDYQKWFKNLRTGGVITKDFRIKVGDDFEENSGIIFILFMGCAKGHIKQVSESKLRTKEVGKK